MSLKRIVRALLPTTFLSAYHFVVAIAIALAYNLPSCRLKVIGVTGTKGKTSTASMLWHILENTDHKTGLVSTAFFAVGQDTWLNKIKMTMPGRTNMQKLLGRMIKSGCKYAVVETSSEGLAQWRHLGIPYSLSVFTNLTPEHIEAHGSYEKYRAAKAKLAKITVQNGGTLVVNLDDAEADYFIDEANGQAWGYTLKGASNEKVKLIVAAELGNISSTKVEFSIKDLSVHLPVGGEFNAYNALAAMTAALKLGIPLARSAAALSTFAGTPGRLEFIQFKPFAVVVDYAHTPESLSALYNSLKERGRLIAVLGSCGGGRDKAKRSSLGKLAGENAEYVIVTDEDPYDENPRTIMETVAEGVKEAGKIESMNYWIIEDRREAIKKALSLAKENDTVVITGKGAEQWLMQKNGKKIAWDDREVVKKEIKKI